MALLARILFWTLFAMVPVGCGGALAEPGAASTRPPLVAVPPSPPQTAQVQAPKESLEAVEQPGPPKSSPGGTAGGLNGLIEKAKDDLVARAGVSAGDIRVVEAMPETWRDSSLGCPEQGRVYAQVLTPGHRILLEAAGRRYEYHTSTDRVVYCPNP